MQYGLGWVILILSFIQAMVWEGENERWTLSTRVNVEFDLNLLITLKCLVLNIIEWRYKGSLYATMSHSKILFQVVNPTPKYILHGMS